MSTRAQVRFATREDGVSFSEHPDKIHAQFYVHSDGYPEGLGLQIADSIENYCKVNNWEIESLTAKHGDLEYIYYIWQKPNDTTWISIFETYLLDPFGNYTDECIFVGKPEKLIEKYDKERN
jgi:spore cortex formation protein SpoVR/YcgB (stage V sporulation)